MKCKRFRLERPKNINRFGIGVARGWQEPRKNNVRIKRIGYELDGARKRGRTE